MSTSNTFAKLAEPAAGLMLQPFTCLKHLPLQSTLRQSAQAMLSEQREEWHTRECGESLHFYLRDRFSLRDWTSERIAKKWNQFVAQENLEQATNKPGGSTVTRRGWLALNAEGTEVLGEVKLWHAPQSPEQAAPFIYLRPSCRGAKLGYELLHASLILAASRGYKKLDVGFYTSQKASGAMLSALEQQGLAEFRYNNMCGEVVTGRKYWVNLSPFKPPA